MYSFSGLILVSRIVLLPTWRGFETAIRTNTGEANKIAFVSVETIAIYSKICLGICQVIAMFEITTKIRQMDERNRKPQRQQKQDERDTAWRLRKWLHGLLITTMVIATFDVVVRAMIKV